MIIGSPNNFHIQKITSRIWLWAAKTSNGLAPLHFRILVDGKKTEISLGIKIAPKDWDDRKQLVKRSNPSFELYNAQIREISTKFVNATLHLKTLETDFVTALMIRDMMFGKAPNNKPLTVEELIKDFIQSLIKGKQHEETTINRYKTQANSLLLFLERENKRSLKLENFSSELMYEFQDFLLTDKKIKQITANKYLKGIKTMFLYAVNHSYIVSVPFKAFKANREKKKPIVFLNESEIQVLENKVFETQRLNEVKDFFLLQCYTGMSYSDLCSFVKEDVKSIGDELMIIKERKKTNVRFFIPFLPKTKAIMEKYNWKLPVKSNQKLNEYLKEIKELCGIRISLTSHIGRKSFLTAAITKGVPIETVAKMAGHTSIRMTLSTYAEIVNEKIINDIQVLKK